MNRTALMLTIKEIIITINFAIAHYNFVAELATIYWYWKIENNTLTKIENKLLRTMLAAF